MNCQNLYILLVLSLLICQNSLASSVKEGSKIDKNVEKPTKSTEKSATKPLSSSVKEDTKIKENVENPTKATEKSITEPLSSVKEDTKIKKNVENPTKSTEKSTAKPLSSEKEDTKIQENVENPTKPNKISTKPPLKGHLLMFHNQGTRSHLIVMSALAKALLENGYKVTTVFYAKMNIVHENYNEILIKDSMAEIYKNFSKIYMETGDTLLNWKLWYEGFKLVPRFSSLCKDTILENPNLVEMIDNKEKIDGVITMTNCGAFLSHLFDTQVIMFSPAGPFSMQLKNGLGNPLNPMVNPHIVMPFLEPMTFFQRLTNIMFENFFDGWVLWTDGLSIEHIRNHFGQDSPDFYSIVEERSSIAIANSHFVTHGVFPAYPNFIQIGGIHCQPGKELTEDLKKFMDSHPEGVVYVSFGSALKPSQMTSTQKNVFIDTFKELKNIPIIWKWDDNPDGIPENVLLQKWLPQNDLLAHPNLKLFVTHGGLLSTQEALYHKVPLVGVPISNDQKPNLMRAQANGYAKMLNLQTMTKDDLLHAIKSALNNQEMMDSMKRMHELFIDHSFGGTPVKKAIAAVDLVVKHKGADFMKPKALISISWYQEHGIDIFVFVILIIIIFIWITLKICFCCLGRCFKKKTKQD